MAEGNERLEALGGKIDGAQLARLNTGEVGEVGLDIPRLIIYLYRTDTRPQRAPVANFCQATLQ